jgi:endonuclease/exonuclease/phosphatase family metal-dependent hydrolase
MGRTLHGQALYHPRTHIMILERPWPSILAEVAAKCRYSWAFGPSFEFGTDATAGGFGNALLTRTPITAVQQWRLFSPPRPYDGTEPSEPRSVIMARLTLSGAPLWLGSTHLPRNEPSDRAAAALRLQVLARRLSTPWIICGDFNAPPSACFVDGDNFVVSPDPVQPTYPAEHPTEPIDYCIAAPGTFLESVILQADGSDHLPLLTTLSLGIGAA